MPLSRISATIPEDVLAAADRKAEELDRSRSWVIAEALRQYVAGGAPRAVREPAVAYDVAAEVEAARDRRLLSELRLSPAERVARAEELGRLASRGHPRRDQVVAFDDYGAFYEWKQLRRIGL